jgi:hypothetical protein
MFWLIVVGVVAFSWGFAAGATHEQYKPLRNDPAQRESEKVVRKLAAEWDEKFPK